MNTHHPSYYYGYPLRRTVTHLPEAAWILMALACFAAHCGAIWQMEFSDQFSLMNSRTVHNMLLVNWVETHLPIACAYGLFGLVLLRFCRRRLHALWGPYLAGSALALPCLQYLEASAYVANKVVRWF